MNKKTIRKAIVAKLEDWIASIEDESVRALVKKNTLVTGGCFASMLLNEEVKDYDIYFKDQVTAFEVSKYYATKFAEKNNRDVSVLLGEDGRIIVKSLGSRAVLSDDSLGNITDEPFEDVFDKLSEPSGPQKYFPLFISSNAITLTNKIQLVIRFTGDADEIHSNFDFVHCMNYFDSGTGEVILRPEALEALLAKELIYKGSKYPLCSIIRTRKYIKRGFSVNAGQYLKMCFQLSQLDLTDLEVLRDQCVGVDSAYFTAVIDGLKNKKEDDPMFKLTSEYLSAVIDRVF